MHSRTVTVVTRWALASALLSGCAGGQTGSPDCAANVSCVCSSLVGRVPVMAEVVTADGAFVTLRIDELLTPLASGGFRIGDRVVAAPDAAGCGDGAGPALTVGAHVFAAIQGGIPACPEPIACDSAASCADGGTCEAARADALAEVFVVAVAAPTDPLDFGNGDPVPLSQVAELTEASRCDYEHPAPPAPPCHDTNTSFARCSVERVAPRTPSGGWLVLASVLAIVTARRRPRR